MDQIVCGIRRHCDAGFFRTSSAEMEQKNMEQYATQMEAARKGIVTEELKKVAAKERMTTEELMPLVAEGKVVICANRHHKCIDPEGVGSMLRTKINVNLGISRDCKDYDVEMEKVMAAVDMGAHAIMDLSSHGNTIPFRRKLTAECPAMIGTVPVYDSVIHYQRDLATLTAKDFIDVVRLHAEDGVDFVTLHCGITRKTIEQIRKHKRKMNIVSRGGSLVFAWMCMTGEENPFYEYYDEILEICREHDVTISLGDACRPGCLADASDVCQIEELVRLGELTKRAWARCAGHGRGTGPHADGSDCSEYEDSADDLHGSTVLCTGTACNGHCPGVRPYHFRDRRSDRRAEWSCIFVLCDTGGASGASECGGCQAGHHCIENCGACGRHCQGRAGRKRD